jgi:signal transduction histidine kinase
MAQTRNPLTFILRDLSVTAKIVTVILLGGGTIIVLATILASTTIGDFETRASESQLANERILADIHFDLSVRELVDIAEVIATDEVFNTAVAIEDQSTLRATAETFRLQYGLGPLTVTNAGGQPLLGQPFVTDTKPDPGQVEAMDLVFVDDRWLLLASAPIVDPVGTLGTVTISRVLDDDMMYGINLKRTIPVLNIHSPTGSVSASSSGDETDHGRETSGSENQVNLTLWQKALDGEPSRTTETEGGVDYQVLYVPLMVNDSVKAVYSVEISSADIRVLEQQLITRNLVLLVTTGFLTLALIYVLVRYFITQPLHELGIAAKSIGAGNLHTPLPPAGKDEIGDLGRAFNVMIDAIQNREANLREQATERERLIKDLQAAKRLAEENSRLKSEFLATMSHELRTPLNAVEGFTSIMLAGMGIELEPKARSMVERIQVNSKRLLQLINDFLDLSRIESGRMDLVSEPLSPVKLAHRWKTEIGGLVEKKSLEFRVEVDPKLPDVIYGDEEALSKIAINLLGNAVKFTNEGYITLALTSNGDTWTIVVGDTGIGIPPHAREFIFEEFRQVDGSSKRESGGTGLGLAITQKIVRVMGGTVTLDSEVGRGSVFTVALPLRNDHS